MNKRGQVTVFIILGIIILAAIVLVFYLTGNTLVNQSEQKVNIETKPLKNYVGDCLEKTGNDALNLIGKQGGVITPVNYRLYENDKVNYLCYAETDNSVCANLYPNLKGTITLELNDYISKKMKECVDLSLFKDAGYKVEEGKMNVNTSIYNKKVVITLDYPLTIAKGDIVVKENKFVKEFNVPLGEILKVVYDIVESEINVGSFENLVYMIATHGQVEIEKQTREDSRIYIINLWQNNYKFKFAVRNLVR
ncbi:hypothetical protein J4405_05905 [Candidatus Woesearchaeota archaeon]|nr:hypothetical protein [Candidatus Woesearchaeota archaeon]